MLNVLIQIDGYDPGAGAPVTLYASSVDDPAACMLNGVTWLPALGKLPSLKLDLFDGAFEGKISSPSSTFTMQIEPWPNFGRYSLADARLRLWTGNVGDAWGTYTLRVDGRVSSQPQIQDGKASVDFGVDDKWLDKSILSVYAGTGGIEGPIAMKGQTKPLALGAPRYVPGTLIDSVNNVYQVSSYGPIQAIEAALERLARFGPAIGDYATYAALVGATIPAGRWGTCLAQGLVRFGAPTTGKVCFLVQGDNGGSDGWARKPGQHIRYLAKMAGGAGKIDDASLNALDTIRPYYISRYLSDQTTARDLIQKIAASVNAVGGVSWLGQLFVVPVAVGSPVATLAADGSSLPPVSTVQQLDIDAPFLSISISGEVTYAVHATEDIAFTATLLPMGDYAAGTTYREGNIVQDQGSSWLYINPTPSAGNAPPTLPTTSNAYWKVLAKSGADGVSGIVGFLTNEATTLPAAADGTVSSYAGASGTFRVFSGATDISALFSLSTQANPQALTVGYAGQAYTVSAGLDPAEDSASLTIRATGSGAYAGVTVDKIFSIGKSKTGAGGAAAKLLTITSDRQTIAYDGTGTATPTTQTTTFTANKQNTTATVTWSITDAAGAARTPVTTYLSASTGDSVTMTEAQFAAARNGTSGVIVTGTLTDGSTLTDKISVVRVAGGADGAPGLNNAAVTIYQRAASAPALPSVTATYTFATGAIAGLNNGWSATPPAGANPLYVSVATASAAGATDTIAAAEWAAPVIMAQNGTNGSNGTNGVNSKSLFIYQRAASTPALPSATATYTFSTQALTGLNNGWQTTIPAGTNPVWVSTASALSTTDTDTIASGEWAAAAVLAQNGTNGTNGANGRDAIVFYTDSTPTGMIAGDTWYKPSTKQWQRYDGTSWSPLLGAIASFDALNASYIVAGTIIASKFMLDNGIDLASIIPGQLNTAATATQGAAINLPVTLNSPNTSGPNGNGTQAIVTSAAVPIVGATDTVLLDASYTITAVTLRGYVMLQRSTDGSTWTDVQKVPSNALGGQPVGTYTIATEDLVHAAGSLYFRLLAVQQAAQGTGDGTAGTNWTITGGSIRVRRFFSK